MSPGSTVPTLSELLDALPADPVPQWPTVPPEPTEPGQGWVARRTEGTRQLVWTQPVPPGSNPGALWLGHRERFAQSGLWPLLVDDDFWEAVELAPFDTDPFADTRALLRRLVVDYPGTDGATRGPMPEPVVDDRTPEQIIISSEEPTTLLLVPARACWVVPQLLGWDGSVNYSVLGREHTAVLGRWAALYGAEPFGLTRDVAQLLVTRPPTDERSRLEAAAEIWAYCPDTVDQGVGTLENLTQMAGGRQWWLWWD